MKMDVGQSFLHERKMKRIHIQNSTHKPKEQNISLNKIFKNAPQSIPALYKHIDDVLQNATHSSTHNMNSRSHWQQELQTVYNFKGSSIKKTLDFNPLFMVHCKPHNM